MQIEHGDYSHIRILIAGCGSIGKRHAQVLSELGVRFLTCCDPDEKQREGMREIVPDAHMLADFDNALELRQFDAAFILTPTKMHIDMACTALRAGCHVFIEKPLAMSTDGVKALKALAAEKRRKVMVGFCFRFHKVLLRMKTLLEQGAIGRLINIRALMGEPFAEIQPNYLNMYYSKYSGAFELVHDLDLALWFAGQPVQEAYAVYGAFSDMGMKAPDSVEILLRFEDRMAATVHLDFYQHPRRRQLELIGTGGTMIVEFGSWDSATLSVYTVDNRQWVRNVYVTRRNDMFADEDRMFLDAVMNDEEIVKCSIDDALQSLEVIETVTGGKFGQA